MILTAFKLERDRNTETESFGYQRPLWFYYDRDSQYSRLGHPIANPDDRVSPYARLGCPITNPYPVRFNIVKIVEYHRHDGIPVVVERLAWQFGRDLHPYRAKYIRPASKDYCDEPILFLANMSAIHQKLSGIDIQFVTPLGYCLDVLTETEIEDTPFSRYMKDIQRRHRTALQELSTQEPDLDSLRKFIVTSLPILEHIGIKFASRPLPVSAVSTVSVMDNPFDTSSVPAISIKHPEVTLYSPEAYHDIARMCNHLSYQYSDVKINYILSGCRLVGKQVVHLVSRYLDATDDVHAYCERIIESAAYIIDKTSPALTSWDSQMWVDFELTYGDEVLIEVYTIDRKQCLIAIHLDLAMVALCSSGVIAIPT